MKKLSIFILIFIFASFSLGKTFAQTSSPSGFMNVEYDLPYQGLLPDNPLYYLKAIRDNVLKFLISDPLKKSQFDLLQADKRLVSSKLLLEKGENDLSITTLSKSGNYFDDAITNIQKAKEQGEDANSTLDQILKSSQKHQQLIRQMENGKKGDLLLDLKFFEDRAHDFQERVTIIKSQ